MKSRLSKNLPQPKMGVIGGAVFHFTKYLDKSVFHDVA
jgi:hypothetical protein